MSKEDKNLGEPLEPNQLCATLPESVGKGTRADELSSATLLTVLEGDAEVDTIIQRVRDLSSKVVR